MIGALGLAVRHARHTWGRSLVLTLCIAVVLGLPLVSRAVVARFEASLRDRAATAPLVVGAKGSRFDLVFAALHFRRGDIGTTPMRVYRDLARERGVLALPLHVRFTARGEAIVATSIEYLERRGLRAAQGRVFAQLGEAVLGSAAAARLGAGVGSEVASDQVRSFDITAPPSLLMAVVGVLAPTGGPDDDAVFVDLETAWVLEGIAHGHEEASAVTDPSKLIGRSDEHVALSGGVVEYQRITPENIASFHVHGARDDLPLTAMLVYPPDDKAATILATRLNASPGQQAVVPARVIDDLIAFVVRIRALFDAVAAVLGAATLVLVGLIAVLSIRARADELATLREIGASRGSAALLIAGEFIALAAIGAAVAAAAGLAAGGLADRLLTAFG